MLAALKEWGDTYCRDGNATAEFQHRCGAVLHTRADCAACGEEIRFEDLAVVGGTHPTQIRPCAAPRLARPPARNLAPATSAHHKPGPHARRAGPGCP
ncbi:hypothetical protein HEP84_55570 [Streptomyces sp. RLB1-33]